MSVTHKQIGDRLFLVEQRLGKKAEPAKPVEVPTNHIVVIDCSGSMGGDLPQIREQLKKKLPKLIGEKDTLSMIWFSGRNEADILLEAEPVATLADLSDVNKAIDRWLKPVGLTGFKKPLDLAAGLAERLRKKTPGSVCSLFFMSDGCDNQWGRAEILKAVEAAAGGLAAATFVEYGYYADRPLLTAMAEKAGGQLIFSEAFDKYQPLFEAAMAKRPTGAPRVEVKVEGDAVGGFAWTMRDGDLTTYGLDGGKVGVPEDTSEVFYLSPTPVGSTAPSWCENAAYAAMSLFSVRMQPQIVLALLKLTGDVAFIDQFSTCFGKQKYSEFMDATKAAAFDKSLRLTKGHDPNKVPADDAYTVLDLLRLLAADDNNRILLDHPEFKYTKISRARQDSSEVLSEDEQKQVADITAKIAKEKNAKKIADLQAELTKITAGKEALKFEVTKQAEGYSISSLVFTEDRANINLNIRREGTVDITKRLPDEFKGKIPNPFPSFIYRNFPIVADGLVNVEKLPVRVTRETADKLAKLLPAEAKPSKMVVANDYVEGIINLRALPVINRQMVKSTSAKDLFEKQFALETARAAQKVFKAFKDERVAKKESASFKAAYGEDGANWLKEQGFTDYSGFNPNKVQAPATDHYIAKVLEVSLKGYSKLPSMNEFKKQASSGKYNGPGNLMKPFVEECEAYLKGGADGKTAPTEAEFIKWVDGKAKDAISETRKRIFEIANIKFAIVVGQGWFTEFSSIDENKLDIDVNGTKLSGTVEMKEVQINI